MNPGRKKLAGVARRPYNLDEDFTLAKAEIDVAYEAWLKRRGFCPTMSWREQSAQRAAKRELKGGN